jgi:hypothetical protein
LACTIICFKRNGLFSGLNALSAGLELKDIDAKKEQANIQVRFAPIL